MRKSEFDFSNNEEHYRKLLTDVAYFLESFQRIIYIEIQKARYDIRNDYEYEDLKSESNVVLITLYRRCMNWFDIGGKYANKDMFEQSKILQSYIKKSYPGRLFNWFMKYRTLKRSLPKDDDGEKTKILYKQFIYSLYDEKHFYNKEASNSEDEFLSSPQNLLVETIDNDGDFEDNIISKLDIDLFWNKLRQILNKKHYLIYEMYYRDSVDSDDISLATGLSKKKVHITIWYINRKLKKHYRKKAK